MVNQGETRSTIFLSAFHVPGWETLFEDICAFLVAGLADGLMIVYAVSRVLDLEVLQYLESLIPSCHSTDTSTFLRNWSVHAGVVRTASESG
ncbi:hypothetical protein CVT26_014805 [Gymnopilus dilepis]|uniref:Uncharacterized protein n=1 Tax=Gymnopilus dilepis TaxID=231916 RepID=A0A409W3T6_9AGAR|nr:hypothetical protein CVT26_014805 [Gymnopilus dilepis]